eukprot:TRINITY_DN7371_c0_g1_i2.p1 TRINITY_DN7371_c0_g1~~TRINITY_DN7371_c0_g1_i2.p1  ORF type:complete len:826 (-),score=201.67 TRINITY_DN7371_c0_g1_i2:101-2386(-)
MTQSNDLPAGPHGGNPAVLDDLASCTNILKQRVEDISESLNRVLQDNHEAHARLASTEEQMKTVRTLFQTREDSIRSMIEKVEHGDWDTKLEHIKQALQDDRKQRLENMERVEILSKRVDYQEQALESRLNAHDVPRTSPDSEDVNRRIGEMQGVLERFGSEIEVLQLNSDLAPRVSSLVSQIKEVLPKVIRHETQLRELADERQRRDEPTPEIANLKDEVHSLKQSVRTLANETCGNSSSSTSTPDVANLKEEVISLKGEVSALGQQLTAAQVTSSSSTQAAIEERDLQEAKIEAFRSEIRELKEAFNESLTQANLKFVGLVGNLDEQMKSLSAASHSLDELREASGGESQQIQVSVEELRRELEALKVSQTSSGSSSELQALLDSHKGELQQEIDSLKASAGEIGAVLATLKEKLARGEADQPTVSGPSPELQTLLESHKSKLQEEMSSLKGEFREDVNDLKAWVASRSELQSLVMSHKSEVKEELQNFKGDSSKLQSSVESLRIESQGLKGDSSKLQSSVESLRSELRGLKASSASSSDAQSLLDSHKGELRDEISSLKVAADSSSMLQAQLETGIGKLQEDLESLKAAARSQVSGAEIADIQAVLGSRKDELQSLKSQVSELSDRLDSVAMTASMESTGEKTAVQREIVELALSIRQDEEAEAVAHHRVLERIDELCGKISEVAASGLGASGSQNGTDGISNINRAVPAEFAQEFETLKMRVEEMQRVERRIEEKVMAMVGPTASCLSQAEPAFSEL